MNDALTPAEQPAARRRTGPLTALAVGSLAGLVLGFGGIASAQTAETPAPSPSTSATPEAQTDDDAAEDSTRDPLCDEDEAGDDSSTDTTASSGSADSAT